MRFTDLIRGGDLTSRQRRMVSLLVLQLGFSLRVAVLHHEAFEHREEWEPLARTYAECTAALETPRG